MNETGVHDTFLFSILIVRKCQKKKQRENSETTITYK